MRAPMAITVIAGLISSTVLTLIVIPVIYKLLASLPSMAAREEATV
jgi:HAE1 family hydrophobic/amphiphilic exporter-1